MCKEQKMRSETEGFCVRPAPGFRLERRGEPLIFRSGMPGICHWLNCKNVLHLLCSSGAVRLVRQLQKPPDKESCMDSIAFWIAGVILLLAIAGNSASVLNHNHPSRRIIAKKGYVRSANVRQNMAVFLFLSATAAVVMAVWWALVRILT